MKGLELHSLFPNGFPCGLQSIQMGGFHILTYFDKVAPWPTILILMRSCLEDSHPHGKKLGKEWTTCSKQISFTIEGERTILYIPSGYLTWPRYRWPIEIDGLPINSMVIFHGKLLVITRCHRSSPISEVPRLDPRWIAIPGPTLEISSTVGKLPISATSTEAVANLQLVCNILSLVPLMMVNGKY